MRDRASKTVIDYDDPCVTLHVQLTNCIESFVGFFFIKYINLLQVNNMLYMLLYTYSYINTSSVAYDK